MAESELMTEHHFYLFGYVVHQYARIESGLNFYIADSLGIDIIAAEIITKPYSSRDFRNVVRALLSLDARVEMEDELKRLLGEFKAIGRIRNLIAHSRWKAGDRPNSIKPTGLQIRNDKLEFVGMEKDDDDYTIEELEALGVRTEKLHTDFVNFFKRHKLSLFGEQTSDDTEE
ncbi:MAG: hypothetical protein AAFZ91_12170 [Pseudomonadota bacterium]